MRSDDDLLCCYFDRVTHSLTHGDVHVGLRVATGVPSPQESLTLCGYAVNVRVVDAAGLGLCRRLLQTLPPELAPTETSQVALNYVVTLVAGAGASAPFEYVVTRNADTVVATTVPDDVYWWIRRDIEQGVARHCEQMVFVHAGVVAWRGVAILVPGRDAVGKSRTVSALVQRGATYYSDTFAVLDNAGRVHPYRTLLEEDPYQPMNLRLISGAAPPQGMPVGLVVTGSFAQWRAWRPTIVQGRNATLPLIEAAVHPRDTPTDIRHIVERVSFGAIGLRGPRPDAQEVAASALNIVDDAVVSLAMAGEEPCGTSMANALAQATLARLHVPAGRPLSTPTQLVAARYVQQSAFLTPAEHQRLVDCLSDDDAEGWHVRLLGAHGADGWTDTGEPSGTLPDTRRDDVWRLFDRRLRAMLPFVRQQLQIRPFQLGRIEWRVTKLERDRTFLPRIPYGQDRPTGSRISGLYILRADTRPRSGELRLFDSWQLEGGVVDAETYTSLHPARNSLVLWPRRVPHRYLSTPTMQDDGGLAIVFTFWKDTSDEGPAAVEALRTTPIVNVVEAPATESRPKARASGRRLVAVVVPAYRSPTRDERISLRHLRTYLGEFDRYVIGAQVPDGEFLDFNRSPASACAFTDKDSYNQMLLGEPFYRAFERYEYVLIHQLDCLVFSNELTAWCEKDFDYVGAPWFNRWHRAEVMRPEATDDLVNGFGAVGNGGFSLRKVDTALAVLTQRPRSDPHMRQLLQRSGNEDIFWSFMAPQLVDRYRLPSPREALSFAFETELRYVYRENSYRLPFGCHGWPNYDREFWEPFLLTERSGTP